MAQDLFTSLTKYHEEILAGLIMPLVLTLMFWLVRKFTSRIKVRRIVGVRDCDWNALANFHHRIFDDRLGEHGQDMKRWIHDWESEVSKGGVIQWHEHLYVAEKSEDIVGYLYASYHMNRKLAFISYFAADDDRFPGRRILHKLLKEFFACLDKQKPVLRAVLAELDFELEGRHKRKAVWTHLSNFGEYAEALGYNAYVITGFEYKQPLIDLKQIRSEKRRGKTDPVNGSQCLLYIRPSEKTRLGRTKSHEKLAEYITADELVDALHFIITGVYVMPFEGHPSGQEYSDYASGVWEKYRDTIMRGPKELLLRPARECSYLDFPHDQAAEEVAEWPRVW